MSDPAAAAMPQTSQEPSRDGVGEKRPKWKRIRRGDRGRNRGNGSKKRQGAASGAAGGGGGGRGAKGVTATASEPSHEVRGISQPARETDQLATSSVVMRHQEEAGNLSRFLSRRPPVDQLVQRNILRAQTRMDPSLTSIELAVRRQMDKDAINRALRHRPSAEDLRARGILKEEGSTGALVDHQLRLLQDKLAHRPALADLRRSAVLRDVMLWTRLDLPQQTPVPPRSCHTATLVGRRVYVLGGISEFGISSAPDVLDVDASCWTRPTVYGSDGYPMAVGPRGEAVALRRDHPGTRRLGVGSQPAQPAATPAAVPVYGSPQLPPQTQPLRSSQSSSPPGSSATATAAGHTAPAGGRRDRRRAGAAAGGAAEGHPAGAAGGAPGLPPRIPPATAGAPAPVLSAAPPAEAVPVPRYAHTAVAFGRSILLFGGFGGGRWLNDLWLLDTRDHSWRPVQAKGEPPEPRAAHAAVRCTVDGVDSMLVVGGNDGSNLFGDVWLLDTSALSWQRLEVDGTKFRPRAGHSLVVVGHHAVMFGGSRGWSTETFSDVLCLDLRARRWKRVSASGQRPPAARSGHGACAIGSRVFIFGGGDSKSVFNDMHVMHLHLEDEPEPPAASASPPAGGGSGPPAARQSRRGSRSSGTRPAQPGARIPVTWLDVSDTGGIPSPRSGHSLTALGDDLLLVGGATPAGERYSDAYTLDTRFAEYSAASRSPQAMRPEAEAAAGGQEVSSSAGSCGPQSDVGASEGGSGGPIPASGAGASSEAAEVPAATGQGAMAGASASGVLASGRARSRTESGEGGPLGGAGQQEEAPGPPTAPVQTRSYRGQGKPLVRESHHLVAVQACDELQQALDRMHLHSMHLHSSGVPGGGRPSPEEVGSSARMSPDISAIADADMARRGANGLVTPPHVGGALRATSAVGFTPVGAGPGGVALPSMVPGMHGPRLASRLALEAMRRSVDERYRSVLALVQQQRLLSLSEVDAAIRYVDGMLGAEEGAGGAIGQGGSGSVEQAARGQPGMPDAPGQGLR